MTPVVEKYFTRNVAYTTVVVKLNKDVKNIVCSSVIDSKVGF